MSKSNTTSCCVYRRCGTTITVTPCSSIEFIPGNIDICSVEFLSLGIIFCLGNQFTQGSLRHSRPTRLVSYCGGRAGEWLCEHNTIYLGRTDSVPPRPPRYMVFPYPNKHLRCEGSSVMAGIPWMCLTWWGCGKFYNRCNVISVLVKRHSQGCITKIIYQYTAYRSGYISASHWSKNKVLTNPSLKTDHPSKGACTCIWNNYHPKGCHNIYSPCHNLSQQTWGKFKTRGPRTLVLAPWTFLQTCIKNSLLQTKSIEIWVNSHTVPHYACIKF